MKKIICCFIFILLLIATTSAHSFAQANLEERVRVLEEKVNMGNTQKHQTSQVGTYGGIINPDISAVVNIQTNFNDQKGDANEGKIRVKEAEFGFTGYLHPGVRGDIVFALEQEYSGEHSVSTSTDLEEAYIAFLDLPGDLQAELGRRFIGFGKLNAQHSHHWAFSDTPRVLHNYFGEHNWFDDGISVSALVPNPGDLYIKTSAGWYNGRHFGHGHDHEEGEAHTVEWAGKVAVLRAIMNLPLGDDADVGVGYSFASDEGGRTKLHGIDFTLLRIFPQSYKKLKWQTEFILSDIKEHETESWGAYSLVQYTLDKHWEIGGRYDWAQTVDNDKKHEWAVGPFVTYYVTHSFYIRAQHRYREIAANHEPENQAFLQCVWGFGPHSHRLED